MECTDPYQIGENKNPLMHGARISAKLRIRTKFPNVSGCEVHPPWARTRFVERDHLGLLPSFRMPKDSLLVHRELSHCSPCILYKIHRHPQRPSRAMCRGAPVHPRRA